MIIGYFQAYDCLEGSSTSPPLLNLSFSYMVMYWLTSSLTWLLIFSDICLLAILRKQTIRNTPKITTRTITKMIQVDKELFAGAT